MIHMYFTDEQCKIDDKTSHNYEVHILPLQTTVFLHFFMMSSSVCLVQSCHTNSK